MSSRIDALRKEILRLNKAYHDVGESDVADDVYDALKRDLRELEGETDDPLSPINQVGSAALSSGFDKVTHLTRMLSLDNVFNEAELVEWLLGLGYVTTIQVEFKFDGLAISLFYDDGNLKTASTRGDGEVGDDITDNALYFLGVPEKIPYKGKLEIRGEAIVPLEAFKTACALRSLMGKHVYANPRNMVAGLARRKDPLSLQGMGIKFMAYDAVMHPGLPNQYSTTVESLPAGIVDLLNPSTALWEGMTSDVAGIVDIINTMTEGRAALDYEIDGLVLKVVSPTERTKLGSRSTSPRWAVAFKFEAQTTVSTLDNIEFQVGRTGVVTPVAKIDPVKLCGVTVSSVTLHNFDEISRLDLRLGDTVVVSRRGDVIPKIESVVTNLRVDQHGPICAPIVCPCCSGALTKKVVKGVEGVKLYCENKTSCPAQSIARMTYFVGRDGIDVKNLGPATVEALVAVGSLSSFSSLFYLSDQDFYGAGVGETVTDKIIANINKAKRIPFYKVLRAVGIPNVADSTARDLAGVYPDFTSLGKASYDELQAIEGIGPEVAFAIISTVGRVGTSAPDLLALDQILTYTVENVKKAAVQDLLGKRVVVSGSDFNGLTRKEMEQSVISRGAKLSKSISKNTDILYAGVGAGPDKVSTAKSLGFIQSDIEYLNPKPTEVEKADE